MASTYAWIITTDHLAEGDDENEAGVMGPAAASGDMLERLRAGEGREFRMYDDDGELYYTGRIITEDEPGSEDDFGPLDDFGTPNAGAVRIDYRVNGKWETL